MFELFGSFLEDRNWTTLMDLSPLVLSSYRERYMDRLSGSGPALFLREDDRAFQARRCRNQELINITRNELRRWEDLISIMHLFVLADSGGVVLHVHCAEQLRHSLQESGVQEGVHFSLAHMGINGISMAMERQSIVVVRGQEHDISQFQDLNCLCIPIRVAGRAEGYLDLSFQDHYDIEFAVPILLRIVDRIESRLNGDALERSKSRLHDIFDQYRLTPREKEAAYGWLNNYSVLRISEEMGIGEGTVRNLIKKVYAKTKYSDKGQFMQAFMRWL